MPDLSFRVESATVVQFAAVPMIAFQLRITNAALDETIHTVALVVRFRLKLPVVDMRLGSKSACSIFLGIRTVGVNVYATCCGPTPPLWCLHSPAQPPLSTCRFHAPLTSMSRRPNISRAWLTAKFP